MKSLARAHCPQRITVGIAALALMTACSSANDRSDGIPGTASVFSGPAFPGAGRSGSGQSISAGLDALGCNGAAQDLPFTPAPVRDAQAELVCFFGDDPSVPAASIEWVLEAAADDELVHVRLTFNPDFVDNSYGQNAIGWENTKKGHKFKDLVGSDHAEMRMTDRSGRTVLQFRVDYLSERADSPSGYGSLGVTGGDGKMIVGDADDVAHVSTSLDRNFNACGLEEYTEDSPRTDASYATSDEAPDWDYRVVYDVWVERSAFGASGFGNVSIDRVHASPSKADDNTIEVTPGECPPTWHECADPDGCHPIPPTPPTGSDCLDPDNCAGQGTAPPTPLACDAGAPDCQAPF